VKEVLARGPNFLFTKKFIISEYGNDVWEILLKTLPKEIAAVWEGAILAHQSYPFSAFKAMVAALAQETQHVEDKETARLYEYIADGSLNTMYKLFFKITSPSFVIKNYPKLWSKFFETGKVEVPVSEKGHALVKFTLPEIFLDWLPPACLGYSKKAVEMAGGRNLTMKEKSKSSLPDAWWEIVYELNWHE
jgi:hypothetical protein